MLMRTDPFRELDRLVERVSGTVAHPVGMPMDAWREGDTFFVEMDMPGVNPESIDLGVERNVLTVRAERKPTYGEGTDTVITERPAGTFSRQLFLGDSLDTEHIEASYEAGVLKLRIPVAEQAKPRKIAISGGSDRKELGG
ncbi:Hsp20/alpha crystallin family protein [Streptomyces spiralis]|uniref:Hsp20/alpha crystallin family protein n=1 Tax=Streptomyces spiralis TaxID=66376 RepID=UPI00368D24C1